METPQNAHVCTVMMYVKNQNHWLWPLMNSGLLNESRGIASSSKHAVKTTYFQMGKELLGPMFLVISQQQNQLWPCPQMKTKLILIWWNLFVLLWFMKHPMVDWRLQEIFESESVLELVNSMIQNFWKCAAHKIKWSILIKRLARSSNSSGGKFYHKSAQEF